MLAEIMVRPYYETTILSNLNKPLVIISYVRPYYETTILSNPTRTERATSIVRPYYETTILSNGGIPICFGI